jgi:hypothetical protein
MLVGGKVRLPFDFTELFTRLKFSWRVKVWVREQSRRFLEQYFRESLGSRHPALTILRRLSAQVITTCSPSYINTPQQIKMS